MTKTNSLPRNAKNSIPTNIRLQGISNTSMSYVQQRTQTFTYQMPGTHFPIPDSQLIAIPVIVNVVIYEWDSELVSTDPDWKYPVDVRVLGNGPCWYISERVSGRWSIKGTPCSEDMLAHPSTAPTQHTHFLERCLGGKRVPWVVLQVLWAQNRQL